MSYYAACKLFPCTFKGPMRTDRATARADGEAHEDALEGHTTEVRERVRASADDEPAIES